MITTLSYKQPILRTWNNCLLNTAQAMNWAKNLVHKSKRVMEKVSA